MRKFSWVLLVLLVFSVYAEDEKAVVVGSAKELKGITAKKIIWKKDGAKMVVVRPYKPAQYEGKKTFDRLGNPITKKIKMLDEIPGLWFDATEVTVGQFKKFLASSNHSFDGDLWAWVYKFSPTDRHPMVMVSWDDATAYAKWARKRLPRGKEWGWAARGGLKDKEYPWGDDESLARDYANYEGISGADKWDAQTAPVGSLKPNGYGLYDVAGNVWEWCQDMDRTEQWRMLRGGGWNSDASHLPVAYLDGVLPIALIYPLGFRCVSESN